VGLQILPRQPNLQSLRLIGLTTGSAAWILYSIQPAKADNVKHSKTTFVFSPELGRRLRDLRGRRSLSLRQLALLMDRRGPGSYNLLGRLERGDIRFPTLGLVADYLRGCGAGFGAVLDLLDRHTSRRPVLYEKGDRQIAELLKALPPGEQRAMLRWERATAGARETRPTNAGPQRKARVITDRERVFRIIWSFIHANWNEVLEQKLYQALLGLKSRVPKSERKVACGYGRRFFGILTRRYASERRRGLALRRIEQQARDTGLSTEAVAALLVAATEAHSELLLSGRLDWEPTEEQVIRAAGRAPRVEKAETRLELDELRPATEYGKMVALVRSMARSAVNAHLEKLRLDFLTRKHYLRWIEPLVAVAVGHGTDSAQWRAEVDRAALSLHDPELVRAAAAIAADTFNRWKKRIPPKP
jgi:transcriptional regulator with XRE-family HTH domain